MEKEVWKDIPDYEGIYQASNLGRIRTCEGKTTYTKRHGIRHWKSRILKPKVANKKRKDERVSLWKDGKSKDYLVSRLVASAFYGKCDLTINHINGNPLDNRIENLEWCSLKENIQKGFETGLYDKTFRPIKVFDKQTKVMYEFQNTTYATKVLGLNRGYFHCHSTINKNENKRFKWQLL